MEIKNNLNRMEGSFLDLKESLEHNKTVVIKNDEINSFFEGNNYDKIYCPTEFFYESKRNKSDLNLIKDDYMPVHKFFCVYGEKYDEVVIDDYDPYYGLGKEYFHMNKLIKIVGEVLNIHEDSLRNESASIELSMKELMEICNKFKAFGFGRLVE